MGRVTRTNQQSPSDMTEAIQIPNDGSDAPSGRVHPLVVPFPDIDLIYTNRLNMQEAKRKHKAGTSCDMKNGQTCGACHFYSGAIAALSQLVGEMGVID